MSSWFTPSLHADEWQSLHVPGTWEEAGGEAFRSLDGVAWYRCFVKVPATWEGRRLLLTIGKTDDVDEGYFNGQKVGAHGSLPPLYEKPSSAIRRPFVVEPDMVRFGGWNMVAWRVYDHGGTGGLTEGPVLLITGEEAMDLTGAWQFRPGDKTEWAAWPIEPGTAKADALAERFVETAGDRAPGLRVIKTDDATLRQAIDSLVAGFEKNPHPNATVHDKGEPLTPDKALAALKLADGLALDLVVHEPHVTQPIHVTFDERGRMWVTQYIQYPHPAGVKVVSYDQHLRAVFDKVPPPPPHHFKGRDKITIHEDTNGDGTFESVKTFVEGLNITTSVAHGRGGVWILNPPYLLFYPDADRDDVPDGDPVVHLSGFGLEDTHAVANSLTWGPDGWLYGGIGSTVTARVKVHLNPHHPPVAFLGQAVWRYHPQRHIFEVFAEGGYNTFGVDFDDVGRVYSGTNASPRGVHFVQGGYYRKSFGKHGPLTNPYAFGYLDAMPHSGDQTRLTHQFILDGGAALPEPYRGKMIAINSLANWVVATRLDPLGSTFKTTDEQKVITTDDKWFRPVHITTGPDGAAYISDWYDARITHLDPRDNWDHDHGRIYRLRGQETPAGYKPFDLSMLPGEALVEMLGDANRWKRSTALRLLADRRDKSDIPLLKKLMETRTDQAALEAAWALYQLGAMDEAIAMNMVGHENEFVRMWGVRFIGDFPGEFSPYVGVLLVKSAQKEQSFHVLSQLAATAPRFPDEIGLAVCAALARRDELADDPFIPLQLWWAVESKVAMHLEPVAEWLNSEKAWKHKLVSETLMPRLARRLASDLTDVNQDVLVRLLNGAPNDAERRVLIEGINTAFVGRNVDRLAPPLLQAIRRASGDYGQMSSSQLALNIRSGDEQALAHALQLAGGESSDEKRRGEAITLLGQVQAAQAVPILLEAAATSQSHATRRTALGALGRFDDPALGGRIVAFYPKLPEDHDIRSTAVGVLLSRTPWTLALLGAIGEGHVAKEAIPAERVALLRQSTDTTLTAEVERVFGKAVVATSIQKQKEVERLAGVIAAGKGEAPSGKIWFTALCSRCHKLHGEGLDVGPDLTVAKRDDLREMLMHIVDPSAGIHEDYHAYTFTLTDGRQVIGFVAERAGGMVKVKDAAGVVTALSEEQISDEQALPNSLMPDNLLAPLTEQQARDLMAYLMSTRKIGEE